MIDYRIGMQLRLGLPSCDRAKHRAVYELYKEDIAKKITQLLEHTLYTAPNPDVLPLFQSAVHEWMTKNKEARYSILSELWTRVIYDIFTVDAQIDPSILTEIYTHELAQQRFFICAVPYQTESPQISMKAPMPPTAWYGPVKKKIQQLPAANATWGKIYARQIITQQYFWSMIDAMDAIRMELSYRDKKEISRQRSFPRLIANYIYREKRVFASWIAFTHFLTQLISHVDIDPWKVDAYKRMIHGLYIQESTLPITSQQLANYEQDVNERCAGLSSSSKTYVEDVLYRIASDAHVVDQVRDSKKYISWVIQYGEYDFYKRYPYQYTWVNEGEEDVYTLEDVWDGQWRLPTMMQFPRPTRPYNIWWARHHIVEEHPFDEEKEYLRKLLKHRHSLVAARKKIHKKWITSLSFAFLEEQLRKKYDRMRDEKLMTQQLEKEMCQSPNLFSQDLDYSPWSLEIVAAYIQRW